MFSEKTPRGPQCLRAQRACIAREGAIAAAALACFAAVLQACAPGQASGVGVARSAVRAASSSTRSELGVASWKIDGDAAGAKIVGLDEAGAAQVEVAVREATPPAFEGVVVRVVLPTSGEFALSPTGQVDRAVTEGEQRLAAALYRDLGQAELDTSASLETAAAGSISSIGPNTLLWELHLPLYGFLFGLRENVITGLIACPAGYVRDHSVAYSDEGASCWVNGWATEIDTDCRIIAHAGLAPFLIDTCNLYVYGHTP